jgi:hypothetical protein
MIQGTCKGGINIGGYLLNWTGKVAAIVPDTMTIQYKGNVFDVQRETVMPKMEGGIEMAWDFHVVKGHINSIGGYEGYNLLLVPWDVNSEPSKDTCVDWLESYVAGVDAQIEIGPVTAVYDLAAVKNPGVYSVFVGSPFSWRTTPMAEAYYPVNIMAPGDSRFKTYNSYSSMQAWILRIRPFEWLATEGAYGLIQTRHDYAEWDKKCSKQHSWYGNFQITIHKTFTFTPEFGQIYYGPKLAYGKVTYCGLGMHAEF